MSSTISYKVKKMNKILTYTSERLSLVLIFIKLAMSSHKVVKMNKILTHTQVKDYLHIITIPIKK